MSAQDAPHDEIVAAVAEELGMTVKQVGEVLDAYARESRRHAETRRMELRNNHVYQQWKARREGTG